jgi:hypothetical protein
MSMYITFPNQPIIPMPYSCFHIHMAIVRLHNTSWTITDKAIQTAAAAKWHHEVGTTGPIQKGQR